MKWPHPNRRKVLAALGVMAAFAIYRADAAFARSIHGAGSNFNGGKSQVNFNFFNGSGDYPTLNLLKTAGIWGSLAGSTPITPDMLDANGYPTTLTNSLGVNTTGIYVVVDGPTQTERPGNYILKGTGNGVCGINMVQTVLPTATFTGSVTANVLTAGAPSGGTIQKGMTLSVGGIIGNQISGSAGVAGTYQVVGGSNAGSQLMTVSGGSLTGSGGSMRYVFSTTGSSFDIRITAVPITNLVLCHVDDEAALTAGQVFGVKFKARLAEANFGVLRFLNWQYGNTTNVTLWNTRKSASYFGYAASELRSNLFAGNTTNSGNAYSIASPVGLIHSSTGAAWTSGGPLDKDTIHIVFNASATTSGTCSFNIFGAGAINILSEYSTALSISNNAYPIGGTYQSLATMVYDADLNAWIKQGGDAASNSSGITNGVPLELMVQLCTEVGAHPWFVIPALGIDPATDFIPSLAAYCRDNAPSWMVPRFEPPNELWNTAAFFYNTSYAQAKATAYHAADSAHWAVDDYQNWYGKVGSVLGQAVSTVYSANRARYQVICGVQTSFGLSTSTFDPRMNSTSYLAQNAAAQSPYVKSAASNWYTHVCCAQYITPSNYGQAAENTEAAAYNGILFTGSVSGSVLTVTSINTIGVLGTGTIANGQTLYGRDVPAGTTILSAGTGVGGTGTYNLSASIGTVNSQQFTLGTDLTQPVTYAATVNSGSGAFNIANVALLYAGWKTWAQSFTIQKMCGYEGGYSPDYTGSGATGYGTSQVDLLRSASKQASTLNALTTLNYTNFTGLTGGGFTAEFPSCFQFSGQTPSTSAWSVLEDIYQSPNPPQLAAIVAFNH